MSTNKLGSTTFHAHPVTVVTLKKKNLYYGKASCGALPIDA
jgi:hypothetical protein